MEKVQQDRRRFLTATLVFSGLAIGGIGAQVIGMSKAWASDPTDSETKKVMLQMVKQMYPHDELSDEVYSEVLEQILNGFSGSELNVGDDGDEAVDADIFNIMKAAESALNAQQQANFIDLDDAAKLAALEAIQTQGHFIAIQYKFKSFFYHHPAVWEVIGYEGPSWMKGGYLHRGAGKIDWLSEYK
jgi:hypothetical protein